MTTTLSRKYSVRGTETGILPPGREARYRGQIPCHLGSELTGSEYFYSDPSNSV